MTAYAIDVETSNTSPTTTKNMETGDTTEVTIYVTKPPQDTANWSAAIAVMSGNVSLSAITTGGEVGKFTITAGTLASASYSVKISTGYKVHYSGNPPSEYAYVNGVVSVPVNQPDLDVTVDASTDIAWNASSHVVALSNVTDKDVYKVTVNNSTVALGSATASGTTVDITNIYFITIRA